MTIEAEDRLATLGKQLAKDRQSGFSPSKTGEVNNHVHTIYSFSPYSPSDAAYQAWKSGLDAVGIMDHESVAGIDEMGAAARQIGIAYTSGFEFRADGRDTIFESRQSNNPDSIGLPYMVVHGVPHQHLAHVEDFLKPIRASRKARMCRQTARLNTMLREAGLMPLDFDKDVKAVSCHDQGGSITERHLLYALSVKMEAQFGRGKRLLEAIKSFLKTDVSDLLQERLSNPDNPHFPYDLLGVFKGYLVSKFFEQPDREECPPVKKAIALAQEIAAIVAYPYLGDVTESPTGDKKAQKFEDEWLGELFDGLKELGFNALTYMPPRNTLEQLMKIKEMCAQAELMEISGVDINSSRQSFRCPEVTMPEFVHLNTSTWALIAHEHLVSNGGIGMFDPKSPLSGKSLKDRIDVYRRLGQSMDPFNPPSIISIAQKEGLWT